MGRAPRSTQIRSSKHGTPLLDWMAGDQQAAGILQTAQRLLAIEAVMARVLPAGLGRCSKAALTDRQGLTVSVPSPAHAARLRQLAPTLANELRAAGWPIEDIVIRIDAGLVALRTKPALRQTEGLGPQALASFESLQRSLRPGPLADAVARLLRHHR
ncbi:MAG TPA: DciA family protein [Castellaniella sp.]|nr:DciA family protein [Castellaniella sp.]